MNIVPYEKLKIVTGMSSEQAKERLTPLIESSEAKWGQYSGTNKPFWGQISDSQFKIVRMFEGVNSFLPVIKGVIEANQILIKMRLNYMTLFILIVGLTLGVLIEASIYLKKGFSFTSVVFLIILILMYSISCLFFKSEVNKARKILEDAMK